MAVSDPGTSAAEAFDYFRVRNITGLIETLTRFQGFAIDHRLMALADGVSKLLLRLLDDIQKVAMQMAQLSEAYIISEIFATHSAKRPITGNMEAHIKSRAGPLGTVFVALIEELDKIVNPMGGYGTFWRAQEFGTGTTPSEGGWGEIPPQEGRIIRGVFQPSGAAPDAASRGLNQGTDLAFEPNSGGGWGTINVELPGRHFLRRGVDLAGATYLQRMGELQTRYVSELGALVEAAKREMTGRGRRFTGRVQA